MSHRIVSVIFFLIFPVFTWAKEAPKDLNVRFLALTAPKDLGSVELVAGKQRTPKFTLPVNNLSMPQVLPARVFSVWAVDKNVSLATITLPEEGNSFIALLIPSPSGGYSPIIMPAENPSFKGGDIYFYNHANKPVLGFVGKSKFTLDPAKGTILKPAGAREERFYDVGLGVREPEGDRTLYTGRWPENNEARFYVFFYINPANNRIAYRAVDEFLTPANPPS